MSECDRESESVRVRECECVRVSGCKGVSESEGVRA